MAEGGDTFTFGDDKPGKDDDEQEVNRQEVNRQDTFDPMRASTPNHDWDQYEMQPMQEQSGLPDTSYEETPLLGDAQAINQLSWGALTRRFPEANAINLETSYSKTGRLQVKMYGTGKKSYFLFTKDSKTGQERLNPSLPKEIKNSLGKSAEQIIEQDRNTAQELRQEADKQQEEAEKISAEREKETQEIQVLEDELKRTQAKIVAREEEQGSNLESESEMRRLKQLEKNHQTELENKKKNLAVLDEKAKNSEKSDQERKKLNEIERENKAMEKRLEEAKRLDQLNKEDWAIINDPDKSEVEKEAAEKRIQARLEGTIPLRERVREIFKKYGVTVTAIFLAAGVTIGAVVGAITNALKSLGNQLANGLKTVGAKAASALPGLIGAIVSFLFKTAGQAIGYLAEHTWLLILAAVVFIFEKYIKKRR